MSQAVVTLRICLVRSDLSHLVCAACGSFRTEYRIDSESGEEPQVGVHERCIDKLRVGPKEKGILSE